jgi:hypothetical protein
VIFPVVAAFADIFQDVGTEINESTYSLFVASVLPVGGKRPDNVPPESVAIPSLIFVTVNVFCGCITIFPDILIFSMAAEGLRVGGTALIEYIFY